MTDYEKLKRALIEKRGHDLAALKDCFDLCVATDDHVVNKDIRRMSNDLIRTGGGSEALELYFKTHLFDAVTSFDSYCIYIEHNRPLNKQFYLPRRKQLKKLADALQRLENRELEILGISLPPGVGKALANDTPILTRNGWKKHGDLVVGDEVIGMDGKFKKVVAVHPKCQLDRLVTFTNGEKIQCHERHEWLFRCRSMKGSSYRLRETREWEKLKLYTGGEERKRGHLYQYQLPPRCILGEEKDLFSPYMLGVWLGDGSNRQPRITNHVNDYAIIDKLHSLGFVERHVYTNAKQPGTSLYHFDLRDELHDYGMCYQHRKTEKHIPEAYLTASIEQRLELVAGLMDTDGSLVGNRYQFSTCDIALKDTFIQLISTFGWRASVTVYEPIVSSSGVIGRSDTYVVSFTPDRYVPCALERKQLKSVHKQRAVAVVSIEKVEPKEGNCITVEGDGMYLAGGTMVPTHNTTLAEFFLTWTGGKHPEKPILTGSHSNSFLRGMYGEILRILDPHGDYAFNDVFPTVRVINTNAQDMMIDMGADKKDAKRFTTFEFSSIGSGNAGKVRAENILYCDDLVDGLESALSKERMDKLYNLYATDLRQRKLGNAVELHIATRWSVHDVLGRLEQLYAENPKAFFISEPAMDENDESRFDYPYGLGYSTKTLREQRDAMDDASWRSLFMNEPVEREGLLVAEEELRRYFELPDGEPDAIISVCDTKDRGTDYCVMPIAYQYGQDYYIHGVICDNSNPEIVEARLISALMEHKVQMSCFESNSAGGKIAEKVQNEIKSKGGRTKITTKYTTAQKETKIIVNSPFWKEHCLFKDSSIIKNDKEYRKFINFLCSYTMMGKNKNDDVPDAMAMLSEYAQSFAGRIAAVVHSPLR